MNDASTGSASRSPIKNHVKRQAGQSLREYLNSFVDDQAFLCVLPLGITLFMLLDEIGDRLYPRPTPLWFLGLLVALAFAHCVVRLRKTVKKVKRLRQGFDGERYVAQIIERDLIPAGYRSIHDLGMEKDGRKFNIDHLLIGGNGVFLLETKTWSKPYRGETVASYDGSKILLNGIDRCGNAVGQARALAKIAEEQILKLTGLSVKVTPFVVCVGWYVRKTVSGIPDVQVVNEEALAAFVTHCPGSLDPADANRISQRMAETFA